MKPVSDRAAGMWVSVEPSLDSLLNRLEALALEPGFRLQRQIALTHALRQYSEYGPAVPLRPLPGEVALAHLYLYVDFYPEDGQFSLIEQLRDMITVHVPEGERAWLDPLRHSYMDLLEIVACGKKAAGDLILRSLGDGRELRVAGGELSRGLRPGQVLLTRLIRGPDRTVLPGAVIRLSPSVARHIYEATVQWQRELEAGSGSFDLGEWEEFAKRYGYILLWNLAQARLKALSDAVAGIRYRTPSGEPFLHALALYEHHEFRLLADGLSQTEGLEAETATRSGVEQRTDRMDEPVRTWVQRGGITDNPPCAVVARLTLTPFQLVVECDSPERLDELKHRLASTFGYALHFRGEATRTPAHALPEVDLAADALPAVSVVVPAEEEQRLLGSFLESLYLEWADQPSPALGGQTPRHASASPVTRAQVAALINRMEQDDLARRRTGWPGYDYNRLRAHVGL